MIQRCIIFSMVFVISCSAAAGLANKKNNVALTGTLAVASFGKFKDYVYSKIKVSSGAEYWFNQYFALGLDLGLGRGALYDEFKFSKDLSTSLSMSYGITLTGALNPVGIVWCQTSHV